MATMSEDCGVTGMGTTDSTKRTNEPFTSAASTSLHHRRAYLALYDQRTCGLLGMLPSQSPFFLSQSFRPSLTEVCVCETSDLLIGQLVDR